MICPKPFWIRFDDGIYDGTRYLTFLGSENYDAIYNIIRYFIGLKSSITYIFSILWKSKLIIMILYLMTKE